MTEILDDTEALYRPHLDLSALTLNGVALGAPAADVPRPGIDEAHSALVARYRGGDDVESEYQDAEGRPLSLDEVVAHVVRSDGGLYCVGGFSYKVVGGSVVGFALYGPDLHRRFPGLASYEQFLAAFGTPDRVREDVQYGDLMGYDAYYWGARKHVAWDACGNRVSLINFGDFEGNSAP
ncbi:hypothetical protein ACIQBJ_13675 [Kitasatospora sp. NPDC088391]|uniref:hypothetical protein n=1 Tax=Kitasatospora sp. NPDC088391 TaxID=3364074 RepID=UPI00381EDF3E